MKASETNLLNLLEQSRQFVIPIYQRTYSWTEKECQQLWKDIIRVGKNAKVEAHFVGSIVYIHQRLSQATNRSPYIVIDGQQRLTTVMLVLEALARRIGEEELSEDLSADQLRNYYLVNSVEKGERKYKLILTQADKQSLISIVENTPPPEIHSIRILENYEFFENQINKLGNDVMQLWNGLKKLTIVDIALDKDHDNPQLIFESMNSTGRELSQADLIRNYVLMGLDSETQKKLYDSHWRPMEIAFGQESYDTDFDGFVRHYLTIKSGGNTPKVRGIYDSFKEYSNSGEMKTLGVEQLVADLHRYAGYYCAIALDKEKDKDLARAFKDMRELKVDVAYPFLLELYHDYSDDVLSREELLEAVRLVESYVFRRAICEIPTNSLNKTFATFSRTLNKEYYLDSIKAHFRLLPSYRRFPRNTEFRKVLMGRDMYNFQRRSYWLRRLENFGRKETVQVNEYTIEHILPQNEKLSMKWKDALGPKWRQIQQEWVHTLGNLTLTGYNSEYSDKFFTEKRDMVGGFKESPIRLNEGLAEVEIWNVDTIRKRAKSLASKAIKAWPFPKMAEETLRSYDSYGDASTGRKIEEYRHLYEGTNERSLFDVLRTQILDLDPCVTEELNSEHIAYKAEESFVEVLPVRGGLRLFLNVRLHEIDDPNQLAKDVTKVGKWEHGDVEVSLRKREELPYMMGLIRQAIEKQLGYSDAVD